MGLSPAPLTSAPSCGLGMGGFCRFISIQSRFWKGHPGFATPSAMVVNCIQEQWSPIDLALQCTGPIHYKKNGWGFPLSLLFSWVFVFPSQIRMCLVQSTEHCTAGPNWPLSAKKWERAGKHLGRCVPPPPAHRESSAQGCWSGPSTEQALSREFLESVDDNPCHQCPHHCCLFSSTPAPTAHPKLTFSVLWPRPAGSSPPSWHQCQHGD